MKGMETLGGTPKPRGTGILPVAPSASEPNTPPTFRKRRGAFLPHWTCDGAAYAATFRLGDSLPRHVLEAWLMERRALVDAAARSAHALSEQEEKRLDERHSQPIEAYLDAGHGACWLRESAVAQLVADALRHFDGQRYQLHAWCVMPNHVHGLVEPLSGHGLSAILHSWKSFTAKAANRTLGRTGVFWQEEYYDHLIRDADDYAHARQYGMNNPAKAGLNNWRWVWSREEQP